MQTSAQSGRFGQSPQSAQQRRARRLWASGVRVPAQAIARIDDPADGLADADHLCDLIAIPAAGREAWIRRVARALWRAAASRRDVPDVERLVVRVSETSLRLVMTATSMHADARTFEGWAARTAAPKGIDYAAVIAWQEELLADEDAAAGQRYWRAFAGGVAEDLPVEPAGDFAAEYLDLCDAMTLQAVSRTARVLGCSPSAFWLACWQALAARLLPGAGAAVGVTLDGRAYEELANVIGPLDRTVPVPHLSGRKDTVARSAGALDAVLREHAAWIEYAPGDDGSLAPWRLGFAHVTWPASARVQQAMVDSTGAPLTLALDEHAAATASHVRLHYDARRFTRAGIRRCGLCLLTLAANAAAHPHTRWEDLPLLPPAEREQIIAGWNATSVRWPAGAGETLVDWLDRQAARTPEAIAVSAMSAESAETAESASSPEREMWSYARLHSVANQMARRLQRLGVEPETHVGIWMERSPLMVAAIVGVLKAGGAYVPFDPHYPAARLATQMNDARAPVMLADRASAAAIGAGPHAVEILDAPDAAWRMEETTPPAAVMTIAPDRLAYVIYTSGSTGTPKGVMVSHRGVVNFLASMAREPGITPDDRLLAVTTLSFDIAGLELFLPLIRGASVEIVSRDAARDGERLRARLDASHATMMQATPVTWQTLVEAGWRGGPGFRVLCGGEALTRELAAALTTRAAAVWNLYGPTETTIWSTTLLVGATDTPVVSIGRPIANTQAYVADGAGQLVPVGIAGELYLGGDGVARGYLRQPGLTAERFVPDGWSGLSGRRLYRTGDRARWREDGRLDFLGRRDQQVKIRGHRIELGEIEAALRQDADVRGAVAMLREDDPGELRIVAYIVPVDAAVSLTTEAVQQRLRARLPDAMIPAAVVVLEAFPLTPNGKIDRRRLPVPGRGRAMLATGYAAPRSDVEAQLAGIWEDVLRRPRVGIHDNFFALGGDSILSLRIVARAMRTGWRLAPRQVFEHPTVAQLASVATRAARDGAADGPIDGPVPLTPIERWYFERHPLHTDYDNRAMRVDLDRRASRVVGEAWATLLQHHDALRGRYVRAGGEWTHTILPVDVVSRVSSIDLRAAGGRALDRLQRRVAAAVRGSLDLRHGPVARAVVCLTRDAAPALLVVVHRLAIDDLSWRVLLEDLETACRQLDARQTVALPTRSSSVRRWAEALHALATGDRLRDERAIWSRMNEPAASFPPGAAPAIARNTAGASRTHRVSVDREATEAILRELPAAGAGHMPDFLLTALAQALADWSGEPAWRIDLEGYGREALDGLDLTRTVGWFATRHPLRLTPGFDPLDTLRLVKATLRAIPRQGLGYGVLRYLSGQSGDADGTPESPESPGILFNYLGHADDVLASDGWLRPSGGPVGPLRDRDAVREYALEVNAVVTRGQLHVEWTYCPHLHRDAAIHELAGLYARALDALIARVRGAGARDVTTPADYAHAGLEAGDLERIARLVGSAPEAGV